LLVLVETCLLQGNETTVFDFTLGTHPITRKGTSELGGAKRRSALGVCLH
jgi:hypothetical protein